VITCRNLLILALLTWAASCASFEGDEPGECADDADNDRDGLFDCDDPDCAGAEACGEAGDDDVGDDDDLDDDDAGDDDTGDDDSVDDDDTVDEIPAEQVEPHVALLAITAPNFGLDLATEHELITLEGVAREDVVQVDWAVEGGASGQAAGGEAWSAVDLPLAVGDNTITVIATTSGGEQDEATIVVTCNPGAPLVSHLELGSTAALVGEPLVIGAGVHVATGAEPSSVVVGPAGADGQLTEVWAELAPSDSEGHYAGSFALTADAGDSWQVRARATFDGVDGHTPPVTIDALEPLSEARLAATFTLFEEIGALWDASSPDSDPDGATTTVTAALLDQALVAQVGTGGDEGPGVWWITDDGILNHLGVALPGLRGGAGGGGGLQAPATGTGSLRASTSSSAGAAGRGGASRPRSGVSVTRNTHAIALAPYQDFFAEDEGADVHAEWQNSACPRITSSYVENTEATVYAFSEQFDRGLVQISSHGSSVLAGGYWGTGWRDDWDDSGQVVIFTRQVASVDYLEEEEVAFRAGQLVLTRMAGHVRIGYLPSWVRARTAVGKMPDSVVVVSACRSAVNSTMAQAYLAGGARVYAGFTMDVTHGYAAPRVFDFWQTMTRMQSSSAAFTAMWTPPELDIWLARPVIHDAGGDLYLHPGEISNGSFESGTLHWVDVDGTADLDTASMVQSLPATSPPDGALFGYSRSAQGDGLWAVWGAPFCPPEGDSVAVQFSWHVVSTSQAACTYGTEHIRVSLLRDEGETDLWAVEWEDICPLLDDGVPRSTGWQSASFPVTGEYTANPDGELLLFRVGVEAMTYSINHFLIDDVSFSR